MKNKAFIGAIAASLVPGQAAMAQNKAVKATADRPNIIFILADDLDMVIFPAMVVRPSRHQTLINWLLRVLDSTRAMPGRESVHHHVVH